MSSVTHDVFMIAGEPSGDALGGALIKAMKARNPDLKFTGVGGQAMQDQGLESLIPMDEICAIGLWEVIGQLPRLLRLINGMVEEIEKRSPAVVVTIDLPDFNFQVAQRLKKRGHYKGKIIHCVAPTVWAWRPGRAKKISRFLDGLLCLFPFEPPYFEKHNLKAVFTGHPMVEYGLDNIDPAQFRKELGIHESTTIVGLFLGSRESEIKKHIPIFRDVAVFLQEQIGDIHFVVPTLPQMEFEIRKLTENWPLTVTVTARQDSKKWEAFAACDLGIAVSGTVGLELAYMKIVHLIAYKVHPVTAMILQRLVKTRYAHLGNILLQADAFPEFLQGKCNEVLLSKESLKLLKQGDQRTAQKEKAERVREMLAAKDNQMPSDKAAAFILSQVGTQKGGLKEAGPLKL